MAPRFSKLLLICLGCRKYDHTCTRPQHTTNNDCLPAQCQNQWWPLQGSTNDCTRLRRILAKYGFGVIHLPDVSSANLATVYQQVKAEILEEGSCFVWLHYSGHAVSIGGPSVLALKDNPKGQLTGLVPLAEVQAEVAPPTERSLLVTTFDGCRQSMSYDDSSLSQELQTMRHRLDRSAYKYGRAVCEKLQLNACMVAHEAHETNHAISGALTNEVCKCLESEPDLPLAEVFRTVRARVKDIYRGGRLNPGPLQDPEVIDQCSDVRLRTLRVSA